jgi:hypothetical protein
VQSSPLQESEGSQFLRIFIKSLHVIFADELGQLSAEEITVYDYILHQIRSSNLFMGGILIIGMLDHLNPSSEKSMMNFNPILTLNKGLVEIFVQTYLHLLIVGMMKE